MKKVYEIIRCPVCGSNRFKIIKKPINKKINLRELKKIYLSSSNYRLIDQLVECFNCKFIYLNPRINSKFILSSYKNNPDKEFVKHNKLRLKTFRYNFSRIKKYLKIKNKKKYRILDVGTGGGTFLIAMNQLGFAADGIEPNKWLVKKIKLGNKKLNVKAGTLSDINKKYDLICFWDVFEHITDLRETLLQCKKILNKQGNILINIPDHGSIARKILGFKWPFFLNVHLYYFEKKTISRLMKKFGFKYEKDLIHFQILPLKYILYRAGKIFSFFNYINNLIPNFLDIGFWYNMGQRIYLFKK